MKSAMKSLALTLLLAVSAQPRPAPEAAWREFTSNEGGFTVSLPGEPQARTVVTYTRSGPLYTNTVSSNDDDLNNFSVSWTSYEDDRLARRPVEKLFDRVREGLLKATGGRLLSDSPVNLDGHPGRAFAYETPDGDVHKFRVYVVSDKFYQVSTQTKAAANAPSAGERFLASFKLRAGRKVL
ncbi:MAG TPA: hypothetical protein VFX96_02000 [Pyrinomonadaceae bacterium]|nr:hypothetical protein [Pyrinomonadaceae bacterium]